MNAKLEKEIETNGNEQDIHYENGESYCKDTYLIAMNYSESRRRGRPGETRRTTIKRNSGKKLKRYGKVCQQ